jgi:glutamate 5-kinase
MGAISLKDNDSLAAMLAAEVQADLLVLMSDVDGIYTKPPSQEGARLICTYTPDMKDLVKFGKKSRVGTGGMDSKVGPSTRLNSNCPCKSHSVAVIPLATLYGYDTMLSEHAPARLNNLRTSRRIFT